MLKAVLVLFALGCLLGVYMLVIEPFWIKVTYHTVKTTKWTAKKPLRIAVLGDMHMIWPWMTKAHLQRIVRQTNALKTDLIILTGDYKGDHPFGLPLNPTDAVKPFNDLEAPCGVYAVVGNHDLAHGDEWARAMNGLSLDLLRNEAQKVLCGVHEFWVAGLDDIWHGNPDLKGTMGQITDDKPIIMLNHNPDIFPEIPQTVAITFSGHTHAGQIRFPFIGTVESVVPSKYGKRYAYGHIREDGKDLFVTSGLGNTGIPLRLLNRPEIALVTLERK